MGDGEKKEERKKRGLGHHEHHTPGRGQGLCLPSRLPGVQEAVAVAVQEGQEAVGEARGGLQVEKPASRRSSPGRRAPCRSGWLPRTPVSGTATTTPAPVARPQASGKQERRRFHCRGNRGSATPWARMGWSGRFIWGAGAPKRPWASPWGRRPSARYHPPPRGLPGHPVGQKRRWPGEAPAPWGLGPEVPT